MELELAQKILRKFKIDDTIISIHQNKNGLINQTFELSTHEKKYILQKINVKIFPNYHQGLENIILIKKWLKQNNYSYVFPIPLQNRYLRFENNIYRILPFVKKSKSINKVSNIRQVEEAVRCMNEFYRCLQDFPIEKLKVTIPNFHSGEHKTLAFNKALNNSNELRKKNAEQLILKIEKNLKILVEWDEVCGILPKRVIHYDIKINNFLFEKNTNKIMALIDLDTLMPGCILSDVGDMIRTYSNPLGEEYKDISKVLCKKNIVAAIFNGFKDSFTLLERQYLNFGGIAITLMQSVRFLTDYLNNDIYYNIIYENQNLVRANNQFKLYQSLKEIKD